MMSDTTIFKGKSDKSEAKSQNEKTKTQKGSTLASAGAGVVTGAAAGLGATYATTARAAEPVEVEDIAAEQAQEPKVEAAAAAHHQSAAAPKPQEPESAPAAEESQQADATPQAQEVHMYTHDTEEQQDPAPESSPNPDEASEEVLDDFEIEGVRVVGESNVEDHMDVLYEVNDDSNAGVAMVDVDDNMDIRGADVVNDSNADVAIVEVDDNLEISDADALIVSNGEMTTIEQLNDTTMQSEDPTSADDAFYDDPYLAQNPDVAPDMPDYMNDGIVEA